MTGQLPPSGTSARILVVDDHAISRVVVALQLELLGLACVAVASAHEALDALRDGSFALLMTDLHMPTMSGVELATQARHLSTIPVVLLTAREDMKYADASPGSPFDAVVLKPVSIDSLRSTLWRLMPAGVLATSSPTGAKALSERTYDFDLVRLDALAARGIVRREFAQEWCQSIEDDLVRLDVFRRQGDPLGVRRQLHRLSGAVGLVGAHELMDVLGKANMTSHAFMLGIVDGLTERVRALMEQVSEWGEAT